MVKVPKKVHDTIIILSRTGVVNMMYIKAVTDALRSQGLEEEAKWIEMHKPDYVNAIMDGMEIEEDGKAGQD